MTEEELMNKMAALMGGRAAEQLVFEQLSTGAADDLSQATAIARTMVMRYGMDESLGQVSYAEEQSAFLDHGLRYSPPSRGYSEQTASQIDGAVRKLVHEAFDLATKILAVNRRLLDETAEQLLEKETLTAVELPRIESATELDRKRFAER